MTKTLKLVLIALAAIAIMAGAFMVVRGSAEATDSLTQRDKLVWLNGPTNEPLPNKGEHVAGARTELIRTPSGLELTIDTKGLIPGGVYTTWWRIDNDADGTPDILRIAIGKIIGADGRGHFSASLAIGNTRATGNEGSFPPVPESPEIPFGGGVAFDNPMTAVADIFIRYHGQANDMDFDLLSDQLNTIDGGTNGPCKFPPTPPSDPVLDGPCYDPQMVHFPTP